MSLNGFSIHSRIRPAPTTNQRPDPATDTTETDEDDDAGESVHPSGAL